MRQAIYLAKAAVSQQEPLSYHLVPTPMHALEMATITAAECAGLEKQVGSIEVGKKADIIVVDMKKPHLVPTNDLIATLVHYATGNDVKTVIVDGRVVIDDGRAENLDEEAILKNAQKSNEAVWNRFWEEYPRLHKHVLR